MYLVQLVSALGSLSIKLFHCAAIVLILAIGCGPSPEKSDSALNWGVLANLDHVRSAGLLSLAPNSRVCVTGYMAAEVIKAIRVWTDIVGRTSYLKVENCADANVSRVIRISGPQDGQCQGSMAGFTNTVDSIKICQNYPAPALFHTLLHETGHMWGLCDQYGGAQGCQWGRPNPNTIMGLVNLGRPLPAPTPDDIEGIKAVTTSNQIPSNKLWLNLAPQTAPQGGAPKSPPVAPQSQAPTAPQAVPVQQGSQSNQPSPGQPLNPCYQFGAFQVCR